MIFPYITSNEFKTMAFTCAIENAITDEKKNQSAAAPADDDDGDDDFPCLRI